MASDVSLWQPEKSTVVPVTANTPLEISQCAVQLSPREVKQIVSAFDVHSYEMVSGFVLTKALGSLRKQLASLGMSFIGEMLGRPDITEASSISQSVTDYETLALAEDLGMITATEALRIKQALETHHHLAVVDPESESEETMNPEEAIHCLRSCVQAVLGKQSVSVAVEFASFRSKLEETTFKATDEETIALQMSPYLHQRTSVNVLLASLKSAKGANLEHAIGNINVVLPLLWERLRKPERWNTGNAYAELVAAGRANAAIGLKRALLAVKGFDYVPENLRSNTFTSAAKDILAAHEGIDNFYNEPAPMKALASLGTSIPMPAFSNCMTATLSVHLGNAYGTSFAAQAAATQVLDRLSRSQWKYYLAECLPTDRIILEKLQFQARPRNRWCDLVSLYDLAEVAPSGDVKNLVDHSVAKRGPGIVRAAQRILASAGHRV